MALYLLKKTIKYDSPAREGHAHLAWNLVFIIGVYLTAFSYGDHEVTNYLHQRFCAADITSDLCRIVIFNDDEFSHWIFFTGFVMVNTAIQMFLQELFLHRGTISNGDIALLGLNAFVSAYFLPRRGRQPIFIYYTISYGLGLLTSLISQSLR